MNIWMTHCLLCMTSLKTVLFSESTQKTSPWFNYLFCTALNLHGVQAQCFVILLTDVPKEGTVTNTLFELSHCVSITMLYFLPMISELHLNATCFAPIDHVSHLSVLLSEQKVFASVYKNIKRLVVPLKSGPKLCLFLVDYA